MTSFPWRINKTIVIKTIQFNLQNRVLLSSFFKQQAYLTQEKIQNVKDQKQWEFSSEKGEEPLGGKHVDLQPHLHEVLIQVTRQVLSKSRVTLNRTHTVCHTYTTI